MPGTSTIISVITSPAGVMVAKHCDDHVCVCVCVCVSACLSVREDISGTTRAIFTNFSVHVVYGRGSVVLRQGDEIRRGRGSFGVFFPLTMHCTAQHLGAIQNG